MGTFTAIGSGLLAFLSLCLHALIEAMPFGLDAAQMAHEHLHDHGHDMQGTTIITM